MPEADHTEGRDWTAKKTQVNIGQREKMDVRSGNRILNNLMYLITRQRDKDEGIEDTETPANPTHILPGPHS